MERIEGLAWSSLHLPFLLLIFFFATSARGGEVRHSKASKPDDIRSLVADYETLVRWPTDAEIRASGVKRDEYVECVAGFRDWLEKILQGRWIPEKNLETRLQGLRSFWDKQDTLMLEYTIQQCTFRAKATSSTVVVSIVSERFEHRGNDVSAFVLDVIRTFLRDRSRMEMYELMGIVGIGKDLIRVDLLLPQSKVVEDRHRRLDAPTIWIRSGVVTVEYQKLSEAGFPVDRWYGVGEWFTIKEDLDRLPEAKLSEFIEYFASDSTDAGVELKRARAFDLLMERDDREQAIAPLMAAYGRAKFVETRLATAQMLQGIRERAGKDVASQIDGFLRKQAQGEKERLVKFILLEGLSDQAQDK